MQMQTQAKKAHVDTPLMLRMMPLESQSLLSLLINLTINKQHCEVTLASWFKSMMVLADGDRPGDGYVTPILCELQVQKKN